MYPSLAQELIVCSVEKNEAELKRMIAKVMSDKEAMLETIETLDQHKREAVETTWQKVNGYVAPPLSVTGAVVLTRTGWIQRLRRHLRGATSRQFRQASAARGSGPDARSRGQGPPWHSLEAKSHGAEWWPEVSAALLRIRTLIFQICHRSYTLPAAPAGSRCLSLFYPSLPDIIRVMIRDLTARSRLPLTGHLSRCP